MLEIFAEGVGFERGRRNLPHRLPPVEFGSSIDESPAIGVKTSELCLNGEKRPPVAYRRFNFHPVSNDHRIQCELPNSSLGISRHLFRIELAEGATITLPLFEHNRPTESRLRSLEHEKLKVFAVIVDGHTPFAVVILEHQRIVHADPGTSFRTHHFRWYRIQLRESLRRQLRHRVDRRPEKACERWVRH